MSDAKLNSTNINEKMNDGNDSKEMQLGSLHTVSQSLSSTDSSIGGQTGMFFMEEQVFKWCCSEKNKLLFLIL